MPTDSEVPNRAVRSTTCTAALVTVTWNGSAF